LLILNIFERILISLFTFLILTKEIIKSAIRSHKIIITKKIEYNCTFSINELFF